MNTTTNPIETITTQRLSAKPIAKVTFLVGVTCTRVSAKNDGSKPSPATIEAGFTRESTPRGPISATWMSGGMVSLHLPGFSLLGIPSKSVRIWE